MDSSWVNTHALDNGNVDQQTSSKQTLMDVAGSSTHSSSRDTQSSSNEDSGAAKKARDRAYKDKSRQKDADKKKLLDLKVREIK